MQRVRCGCISVQFANEAKNENKRATFGWRRRRRRRVFLPSAAAAAVRSVFTGCFRKGTQTTTRRPYRSTAPAYDCRHSQADLTWWDGEPGGQRAVTWRASRGVEGAMRNAVAAALHDKKGPPPPPPGYRPNIVLFFRIDTCRAFSSYSVFPRLYVITLWWRCVCTVVNTHTRTRTHATCQYYYRSDNFLFFFRHTAKNFLVVRH